MDTILNKSLMIHKNILLLLLSILLLLSTACTFDKKDSEIEMMINRYQRITPEELLKKGSAFSKNNMKDSALISYSLIYNRHIAENDIPTQRIVCKALHRASIICLSQCDYKLALELLLRALEICERINDNDRIGGIYNGMGNVYYQFKDYKQAKKYYILAYGHGCEKGSVLNNLGMIASEEGKQDSALSLFEKSYRIQRNAGNVNYNSTLNNIGIVYQKLKKYDSAYYYCHTVLENARRFNDQEKEAIALSNIGSLHTELHRHDSATYYLNQSNHIASRIKLFNVMASNYLYLSEIEEAKGGLKSALELYKKYSVIEDSLFNASEYSNINGLQFMYDMGKVDKKIKQLNMEQEIKERTIKMQYILQIIIGLALLVVVVFLTMLYFKNKTVNRAYNVLVSKNIEIVKSDEANQMLKLEYEEELKEKERIINDLKKQLSNDISISEKNDDSPKYKNSSLSDDSKNKLISDILEIMNNCDLICDPDFSLSQLAEMVGSNQTYVSQTINDTFKRNFRTFINDYRIKEARRMLSDPGYKKYSIKSISTMVGFKSRNTFDTTFKEVTGITPSFYLRSLNQYDF